jgi:hypothetical protein
MSIRRNGRQPGSSRGLPATRPAAPAVATQVVQPQAAVAVPGSPPRHPDLAVEARRGRFRRLADLLRIRAGFRMKDRVRHPDGGRSSVEEIVQQERELQAQVNQETKNGSRKHHRLSRVIGLVPKLVLVSDFCLLLYFLAGITNVNWAAPLSMALAFAAVLAGMVTALSYGFLTYTGHRMRSHKGHDGSVHVGDLDGFTKATFVTALGLITMLALMMFIRMRAEVLGAVVGPAGATALVIPLALAVVTAVANYLVIAIHTFDGSDEVGRLDRLARATRRSLAKAQRMQERAAIHDSHTS